MPVLELAYVLVDRPEAEVRSEPRSGLKVAGLSHTPRSVDDDKFGRVHLRLSGGERGSIRKSGEVLGVDEASFVSNSDQGGAPLLEFRVRVGVLRQEPRCLRSVDANHRL